jgi:hypothetical protein
MSKCEKTTTLIFFDLQLVQYIIGSTGIGTTDINATIFLVLLVLVLSNCSTVTASPIVEVEVTLRPTVSRPGDQFFFFLDISFRHLRVCYFVAPSLTRGRVCKLLLLLVLTSAVTLRLPTLTTGQVCLLSSFC